MQSTSGKWLVGIVGIVVALIAVSVVIALVNPRGNPQEFPADTPEGVVQRYLKALEQADYGLAYSYYGAELRKACTADDIRNSARWTVEGSGSRRIELVSTDRLSDGKVQVQVRIIEVNVSPPFGVDEFSHEELYVLLQEEGAWRLDSLGWPAYGCPGLRELKAPL